LVAAAVASLTPERVAIVDDRGTLLAGGDGRTGPDADAAGEEQNTTGYEDRLRQRLESIVASVVGPGHVRVQVAADMNYDRTSTTQESYDPDSKVVRSTQTVEQNASDSAGGSQAAVSVANALPGGNANSAGGDAGKSVSGRTEETTNYEISKKVTTSTQDGGEVKRLSVAVVVDGTLTGDGPHPIYRPRSPAEMAKITSLVRSAMGFEAARGDQVQVTNMQFARVDMADAPPAAQPFLGLDGAYWFKIIEAAILCVTALLLGLFVARPLINRMFAPAAPFQPAQLASAAPFVASLPAPAAAITEPGGGQPVQILPPPQPNIDLSRIEGQVRESSVKKIGEVVNAHPEEALAIIRTWLHQPV
ncbi:MAG: flagellar M-ring protein FliF, partial [Rhizomicrobium sp.]